MGGERDQPDSLRDLVSSETAGPASTHSLGSTDAAGSTGNGPALASPASTALRYRVLRQHARGGLGEVLIAEDTELRREVALKEIQTRFAQDPISRQRFELEAEITGHLEHPGIVPVYGLGRYPDGRPYYAMRLIRGESLSAAIARFHHPQPSPPTSTASQPSDSAHSSSALPSPAPARTASVDFSSMAFRQLLGRFVHVCQAIAYAHSRAVLHRDLKPSNVMLGKFGETLVVDWGLAKILTAPAQDEPLRLGSLRTDDASQSETRQGSIIGTPTYMSPEQAAGELDRLSAASDIYSLGATLYQLLTGSPPFDRQPLPEMLREIQAGRIPPLQSRCSSVPAPLAAICLRAMSLRPEDRYASCEALADEIERYLADEPVLAYREPWRVRLRRWSRRHPRMIAATTATLLVGMTSAVAIAAIVWFKNDELATANSRLSRSIIAEQNAARAATENAAVAKQQSELALETLTSIVKDVQSGLHDLSSASPIRRRLLAASLGNLDKVARRYVDEQAVDEVTFQALYDLGTLVLDFGTEEDPSRTAQAWSDIRPDVAGGAKSNLSDEQRSALELSERLLTQALQVATRMGDASPDASTNSSKIFAAKTHRVLAMVATRRGNPAESLRHYQQAQQLIGDSPDSTHQDLDRLLLEADLLEGQGDVAYATGSLQDAEQYFTRYLELLESTIVDDAIPEQVIPNLAIARISLGDLALRRGKAREALGHFQESLRIRERWVQMYPTSVSARRGLSTTLERVGLALLRDDQPQTARPYFERMLDLKRQLAQEDPLDPLAKKEVAIALTHLAAIDKIENDLAQAIAYLDEAQAIVEALYAAAPDDANKIFGVAAVHERLGMVLSLSKQLPEATAAFERALEMHQQLLKMTPDHQIYARSLANCLEGLANIKLELGELPEALSLIEQAVAKNEASLEVNPDDREALAALFQSLVLLERLQKRMQDPESARQTLVRLLQLGERALASGEDDYRLLRDVAEFHLALAHADSGASSDEDREHLEQALLSFDAALAALSKTMDSREGLWESLERYWGTARPTAGHATEIRQSLLVAAATLGESYRELAQFEKAIPAYRQAARVGQQLLAENPEDLDLRSNVGLSLMRWAEAASRLNRIDRARELYLESITLQEAIPPAARPAEYTRGLALAHSDLGDLEANIPSWPAAEQHYRAALEGFREFARQEPQDPRGSRSLGIALDRLILALEQTGQEEEAQKLREESRRTGILPVQS